MMGVHQKIDRIAHRNIIPLAENRTTFPNKQQILHFEGLNGPDGIKRKSPGKDEPWHYIDPNNPEDRQLTVMITDHIHNMAAALKANDMIKAGFEAAWMAHAIVDGLTPAHHYPLEAKLEELREQGLETRNSTKEKILLPGKNRRIQLRNNWEYWGAKGVMTTHFGFELGVASTISTHRFEGSTVSREQCNYIEEHGFAKYFEASLQRVADMGMYDEFSKLGWTRHLARETKNDLIPEIAQSVTLGWYQAIINAEELR